MRRKHTSASVKPNRSLKLDFASCEQPGQHDCFFERHTAVFFFFFILRRMGKNKALAYFLFREPRPRGILNTEVIKQCNSLDSYQDPTSPIYFSFWLLWLGVWLAPGIPILVPLRYHTRLLSRRRSSCVWITGVFGTCSLSPCCGENHLRLET